MLININGTSPLELYQQAQAIAKAARDLMEALAAGAPHERDYPGDPVGYKIARKNAENDYAHARGIAWAATDRMNQAGERL